MASRKDDNNPSPFIVQINIKLIKDIVQYIQPTYNIVANRIVVVVLNSNKLMTTFQGVIHRSLKEAQHGHYFRNDQCS